MAAVLALIALSLRHAATPQPVASSAAPAVFASARAMDHLRAIARTPHPTGTAANAEVRNYLVAQLTGMGLAPEVHPGIGLRRRGNTTAAGNVSNVVVWLPGRTPGKAVLLAAHYDSAPHSPGAADNGASVAAIMETLRALKASQPLQNDVIAIFTDGEEAGLLGAESFVAQDTWAKQVGVVLNFEYRGNAGPLLMYETSAGNGRLIDGLKRAAHPLGNSLMYEVYKQMPNDTDMTAFRRAGMVGLNFGAIDGLTSYHSVLDRPDLFHEGSLQHQGELMLSLVRYFGNASLDDLKTNDSVYFDMAGFGMFSYPVSYVLPLSALGVLLFAGTVWVARKNQHVRLGRLAMAAAVFLGLLLLFAVLMQLLWFGVKKIHPDYSLLLLGDTYNSHWYLAAFSALTTGGFWLVQARMMGRFNMAEMGLGAALFWLVLLLPVSVLMPGASFLLLWPLAGVLASFAICFSAWGTRQSKLMRTAILLLGAAPAIVLFSPFVRQIFVALTPQLLGVPMMMLVLVLGLMTPLLCLLAGFRILPLAHLAAGLCLFAVAGSSAEFGIHQPRPNSLSYVQVGDKGEAYWLSNDRDLDMWTRQFFPDQTVGTVPEVFGPTKIHRFYASTSGRRLAAPTAEFVDDVLADGKRTLTLRIKSQRDVAKISVGVEGTEVLASSFEGRILEGMPAEQWQLDIYGVPAGGNLLKLTVAANTPFQVRLTDTSYGLELPPGRERRNDMMPQPFRDSDTTRVVRIVAVK